MGLDNPIKIILIIVVLLLLFGAKRLPEIGRSMGHSLREFKSATRGLGDDVKSGLEEDEEETEAAPPTAGQKNVKPSKSAPKRRAE